MAKAEPFWFRLREVVNKCDRTPLLQTDAFHPLQQAAFFPLAHADPNGNAVVWNDDIDLAESEIWIKGIEVNPDPKRGC